MKPQLNLSEFNGDFRRKLQIAMRKAEVTGIPNSLTPADRIYLIGNGGSATIAQHIAVDMTKMAYCAHALTDPSVLSMMANDYGWTECFSMQLAPRIGANDWLIAISSSGKSDNIRHAAKIARDNYRAKVMTLTGFEPDNPLRSIGHVNWYVPSHNYGVVEMTHLAILHSIVNPGL